MEELQRNGDVWVAPARVDGKVCLRPCVVSRTTDDDVRALVELARESARHSCEGVHGVQPRSDTCRGAIDERVSD